MIKIGLMGFDFNCPNKGCEALSYTFISMLSELVNDKLEVNVFAYADLGNLPQIYPNIKFIWHRPNMKNPIYLLKSLKLFNTYTCIFDITYGDGFSDIYGKIWNANTDMLKQIANMSKAPLILLPQTYGPYKSKLLKKWAVHIVKRSMLAFSRDDLSAKEMCLMGCNKVIPTTDLAFALPFYKNKYVFSTKKKIGFNVSSLLWDGGHQIVLKTNYKEYCYQIIEHYINQSEYEVHLIPHVIDTNNYYSLENDSRVCELLHQKYPNTILAPDFENPIDAKSYISNMDVFIGARMHATIAAMSSGVPTIPFSYSKKFEGLFGNLNYPYIISATKINTNEAINLTEKYISERTILKNKVNVSITGVNEKTSIFKDKITKVLQKEGKG